MRWIFFFPAVGVRAVSVGVSILSYLKRTFYYIYNNPLLQIYNVMPQYSYLKTLKQVHILMRDFAEDFDDNFYMGVCKWKQHIKHLD